MSRGVSPRVVLVATIGLLCECFSPAASKATPDPRKAECIRAHAEAQRGMRAQRLLAARTHLEECADVACPPAIQTECAAWLQDVKRDIPAIVPLARFTDGTPADGVRVLLDGRGVDAARHGSAVAVDPGVHVLRIEVPGRPPVDRTLTLERGSGEHLVVVEFAAEERPSRADTRVTTSAAATVPGPPAAAAADAAVETRLAPTAAPYVYGLLGLTAVSAASFGWFALSGHQRQRDLESSCAPNCASADVASMRRDYLIADLSLGVGVAAFAASMWLTATQREAAPRSAVHVGVSPAGVAVSGAF